VRHGNFNGHREPHGHGIFDGPLEFNIRRLRLWYSYGKPDGYGLPNGQRHEDSREHGLRRRNGQRRTLCVCGNHALPNPLFLRL
jgi:hypothetical protein